MTISDICYGHHGGCPCQNIMSGVKFSRLNAKTAYYTLFQRHCFVFWAVFNHFLGVKFEIKKSCLCKRNDKYQVCPPTPRKALRPSADLRPSGPTMVYQSASPLRNRNDNLELFANLESHNRISNCAEQYCRQFQRVKIKFIFFQLILEMDGLLSADEEHGHS